MARGRTRAVLNAHEIVTGDFTRDRGFHLPTDRLTLALRARLGDEALRVLDATRLAEKLLGDAIYANVLMLGAAWQAGLVPARRGGAAPRHRDQRRRRRGQQAGLPHRPLGGRPPRRGRRRRRPGGAAARRRPRHPRRAARRAPRRLPGPAPRPALPRAHRRRREGRPRARRRHGKGYHKLLSYKDEYEVARLHAETLKAAVDAQFTDVRAMRFHLAPPILGGTDASGRPKKRELRPLDARRLRPPPPLQGACAERPLDPFGYTAERRMERELIARVRARHGRRPRRPHPGHTATSRSSSPPCRSRSAASAR